MTSFYGKYSNAMENPLAEWNYNFWGRKLFCTKNSLEGKLVTILNLNVCELYKYTHDEFNIDKNYINEIKDTVGLYLIPDLKKFIIEYLYDFDAINTKNNFMETPFSLIKCTGFSTLVYNSDFEIIQ